jgi:DNA-binding MarR family transcriptional regulator
MGAAEPDSPRSLSAPGLSRHRRKSAMTDDTTDRQAYYGHSGAPGSIFEIMGLLRRIATETDQFAARFAGAHDLHRTDLNALSVLMDAQGEGRPMSAGELSARLHLSAPATTALLDRLTRVGHVQRRRSSVDRRIVEIEMSEGAREVGRQLFGPLGRRVGEAVSAYTDEERALMTRMLQDVLVATMTAGQDFEDTGLPAAQSAG